MDKARATLATPANMRAYEVAHPGKDGVDADGRTYHVEPPRAVALDLSTGETYSASAGDYWQFAADEPLKGDDMEPCILVVPFSGYRDALTGETL